MLVAVYANTTPMPVDETTAEDTETTAVAGAAKEEGSEDESDDSDMPTGTTDSNSETTAMDDMVSSSKPTYVLIGHIGTLA